MLKTGEINNCINCGSSYSQYNNDGSGNWLESWSKTPYKENNKIKEPKGLCQFCNPKTPYYNL